MFYFQKFAQKVHFPAVKFFHRQINCQMNRQTNRLTNQIIKAHWWSLEMPVQMVSLQMDLYPSPPPPSPPPLHPPPIPPPLMWFTQLNWTLLLHNIDYLNIYNFLKFSLRTDRPTNLVLEAPYLSLKTGEKGQKLTTFEYFGISEHPNVYL